MKKSLIVKEKVEIKMTQNSSWIPGEGGLCVTGPSLRPI